MSIGQRIRELRGIKTLNEFSEKLGIKVANISSIENGHSGLSVELALKITEVCGVSMDWWLIGEEKPPVVQKPLPGYVIINKDELLDIYRQLCRFQKEKIDRLENELRSSGWENSISKNKNTKRACQGRVYECWCLFEMCIIGENIMRMLNRIIPICF